MDLWSAKELEGAIFVLQLTSNSGSYCCVTVVIDLHGRKIGDRANHELVTRKRQDAAVEI